MSVGPGIMAMVKREGSLGECGERVLPLVAKMIAELYENGWGPYTGTPGYSGDQVISASAGDEVIGFISVRDEEKTGSLWVMGGYVLRECRRQGIYTKLWQRVIEYAKEYQAWKLKQVA